MTYQGNLQVVPGQVAGEDLSSGIFKFVKKTTDGIVVAATAGERAIGVLLDNADSGYSCSPVYAGVAKVKAGASIAVGAKVMVGSNGVAVTHSGNATAASVESADGPFEFAAGDTLVLNIDAGGNETCTFAAAAGTQTDTTSYPVTDQDGLTSVITIDGGDAQTVTFSGAHTTAAQIAASLNIGLVGASAAVVGGQVKITSDSKGTGSTVSAAAGTGGLTWAAAVAGTGDAVDISAVTAAEVKTVVEADTTGATVTVNADGSVTITSDTTGTSSSVQVVSGNCVAKMGLTAETVTGTAANSVSQGTALEAAGGPNEIIPVLLSLNAGA
jgi:hypothetical protein